jgi:hypothetical protein
VEREVGLLGGRGVWERRGVVMMRGVSWVSVVWGQLRRRGIGWESWVDYRGRFGNAWL